MSHGKEHRRLTSSLADHWKDGLLISIDYDHTYTADPDFWDAVIELAKFHGHKFICVTNRAWTPNITKAEPIPDVPIIAAADQYKESAALLAGHKVDIWIDDMPGTVQNTVLLP